MRLNPLFPLEIAESFLAHAIDIWSAARVGGEPGDQRVDTYLRAVNQVAPRLAKIFLEPDLAGGMQSANYWNLFDKGRWGDIGETAVFREMTAQQRALDAAQAELRDLRAYVDRPGLPIVYDTNMLLWWPDPGQVLWQQELRSMGVQTTAVRLIIPLVVIAELDTQKYGTGPLAKRASKAIVALERLLGDTEPSQSVELRSGVTLEVRVDPAGHRVGQDADGQILSCATELHHLNPEVGVRVLSDDTNMRLRARYLGLTPMRLPERLRKPGSAIGEVRQESDPESHLQ